MAQRLRTFIGIDPGKNIRERLVALQETLSRTGTEVKWVEPENLHVTLLFLGEVAMTDIPAVCNAVGTEAAKHASFAMTVATTGSFPNPRRPRTIWAGVTDGSQEICAVHDALEAPLLDLGCYRREDRKYTPHITLGRVKGDRSTERLSAALARNADWNGGHVQVSEIHVLSSELTSEGPIYTVLSRAKLG